MLIGLTGLAGSGKSEVAGVLMREFGFERVKFADPLKNMIRTMLRGAGVNPGWVERYVEGDLKEVVIPELGVTPRHLMVTLGTEWGRDCISPDLWTRLWGFSAGRFELVLADDVRFPNEVAAIREHGGLIWKVTRPGIAQGSHASEQLECDPDLAISNTGTLEELQAFVRLAALTAGCAHV